MPIRRRRRISLLAKAIRDKCDAADGIVDGVVSNQSASRRTIRALRHERVASGTLGPGQSWVEPRGSTLVLDIDARSRECAI
ncbi:tannase/feruloyl esterase family alpha/beta hydrolase [Burkholderia sp. Bp9142]|nr:tannase/feruloyl esterase family alpha/beta hydrolase [Burkholderia sp. Bp9142]